MTSTVSTGATETSTEDDEFAKVSEVVRCEYCFDNYNATRILTCVIIRVPHNAEE